MTTIEDAVKKSIMLSEWIAERDDEQLLKVIEEYDNELVYDPIEELGITHRAWERVREIGKPPRYVFAHPRLLEEHPRLSLYYRGMTLLSQKAVGDMAAPVAGWEKRPGEKGYRKRPISQDTALRVARLYNRVLSQVVEHSAQWTLADGRRNILATMGISLDGSNRNRKGSEAEKLIKARIHNWLLARDLVNETSLESSPSGGFAGVYKLRNGYVMRFGSEPDIEFSDGEGPKAAIEIKGGTDRAAAQERLGAAKKSFDKIKKKTKNCIYFLIVGVMTDAVQEELDEMGDVQVKTFRLDDLSDDGEEWEKFTEELFHFALRLNGGRSH